jgi:hypothetical protein
MNNNEPSPADSGEGRVEIEKKCQILERKTFSFVHR